MNNKVTDLRIALALLGSLPGQLIETDVRWTPWPNWPGCTAMWARAER